MSKIAQATSEAQQPLDTITIKVPDARLREIVSDESQELEKRQLAYELTSARTSIALLIALGMGGEQ